MERFCFRDALPPFDDIMDLESHVLDCPATSTRRLNLLSIPAEIRLRVLDYLIDIEQEHRRERLDDFPFDDERSDGGASDDLLSDIVSDEAKFAGVTLGSVLFEDFDSHNISSRYVFWGGVSDDELSEFGLSEDDIPDSNLSNNDPSANELSTELYADDFQDTELSEDNTNDELSDSDASDDNLSGDASSNAALFNELPFSSVLPEAGYPDDDHTNDFSSTNLSPDDASSSNITSADVPSEACSSEYEAPPYFHLDALLLDDRSSDDVSWDAVYCNKLGCWYHRYNDLHSRNSYLPLKTIRPPSALGICRQIRTEYLAQFFKKTIFRVDAAFEFNVPNTSTWTPDSGHGGYEQEYQGEIHYPFDTTASAWLASLTEQDRALIQFRRLIFNPINRYGVSPGFALQVHQRRQAYRVDMRICEGWKTIEDMVTGGAFGALLAPKQIVASLAQLCSAQGGQGIGLGMVESLESKFGRETAGKNKSIPLRPTTWEQAVMLLPEDLVERARETKHCLSEVVRFKDYADGVKASQGREDAEESEERKGTEGGEEVWGLNAL